MSLVATVNVTGETGLYLRIVLCGREFHLLANSLDHV